jgi:ATP-dependent 26S proteasome regulatory subunit
LTGPDEVTLESVLSELMRETDGLSFAHLQEILRASGLAAIHAGRSRRTGDDLLHAAADAKAANDQANRGFPIKPDAPFGLARRSK